MRLLEALLGFANYELDGSGTINLTFRWENEDDPRPQLVVETTLEALASLTKQDRYEGKLETEQVRMVLNSHMKDFLGILTDNRVQPQGLEKWHFTLTLWSKDTTNNLRKFEEEWKRKHPSHTKPGQNFSSGLSTELERTKEPHCLDLDALVQDVRKKCYDKIQRLYGKMQLLDISHPVDVDLLYVEVNILEQLTSQQWLEISDLLQEFDPDSDNFNRFGLGEVRLKRVLGLEVVKRYDRLMVLGKPGSGKTTFLQHLAIECNQGRLYKNRVPIFIRLKDFAEYARDEGNFKLVNYINREWCNCGILKHDLTKVILNQGRGLILLDGLDEVSEPDEDEVIKQIRRFSEDYYKNTFVVSCRISASRYRFSSFTEVEIADFSQKQIQSFAEKWFFTVAQNNQELGLAKAKKFVSRLNLLENKQIRELVVTPILLNLACLVFESKMRFPSKRSKLYEEGLDILLAKWDKTRGIKRDKLYRDLSLIDKKKILNKIASIFFQRGELFFEKNKAQKIIANHLRTLCEKWWLDNGSSWKEELRNVMIEYRNICHDWQFSTQQIYLLKQYYSANKLLVDCLNRASSLTPILRQEIEDTLLLPIVEIKKKTRESARG